MVNHIHDYTCFHDLSWSMAMAAMLSLGTFVCHLPQIDDIEKQ